MSVFVTAVIYSGRKPSIWDTFVHQNGTIADGSTGDEACKSYEFYLKDVDMLKNLGVDSTCFFSVRLTSKLQIGWLL